MNLRDILFGIGIMILTIFVTVYGMSVFYPSVEYEDYCKDIVLKKVINTEAECIGVEGKWTIYDTIRPIEAGAEGYCDRDFLCREDYNDARESRSKKIFFIAVPLGIILLLAGGFLFGIEAIGAGLMGGGIGTIVYGAGGYWQYGGDLFRFIMSLLGLAAVVYLAYWFNKKFEKKAKKK